MKRPWEVTILGLVFIFAGSVGLYYHVTQDKLSWEMTPVLLLRLAAVVGGIFLLLGKNWARWLTVMWLALHVVISAFHSMEQMAAHGVLLAVVTYFLFKDRAAEYFHSGTGGSGAANPPGPPPSPAEAPTSPTSTESAVAGALPARVESARATPPEPPVE